MKKERYEEILRMSQSDRYKAINDLTLEERKDLVRFSFDKCVEKNGEALRRLSEN